MATAEEAARVQRFLLREYRATCALRDALDGRTDVGALRPIAVLPEANAIVTEEVSGQPLGALIRRARHPDASLLESFRRRANDDGLFRGAGLLLGLAGCQTTQVVSAPIEPQPMP